MKKYVCLLIVSSLFATMHISAQEVKRERNISLSAGLYYGQFTDDFIQKVYPSFSVFDVSLVGKTKYSWVSLGLFLKQTSAKDGDPQGYGFDEESATAELKMFSWGPEIYLNASENFSVFARLGFLKISEEMSSDIGDDDISVKGYNIDVGARFYIPLSEGFKLFGKGEYSTIELNEGEANGEMNTWNIGGGIAIFF